MSIRGFETLACPTCGGEKVIQVFTLRWKEGAGSNPSLVGWQCTSCSTIVDAEKSIKAIKLKHLQREIEEKQAELT